MFRKIVSVLVLSFLFALSLGVGTLPTHASPVSLDPKTYVAGDVIIKFKNPQSSNDQNFLNKHQLHSADKFLKHDGKNQAHAKLENLNPDNFVLAKLSDTSNFEQQLQDLNNDPAVQYAEPNLIVTADVVPNDTYFGQQWGMQNTGQNIGVVGTPGADIHAVQAWDTTHDSSITVGVIDTGIDYSHPDLSANMWTNSKEIPNNGIDDDGNGYVDDYYGYNFASNISDPYDDNNHGTHVAGIIAARGNNATGVAGVNWTGKVAALKFMDYTGTGTIANAIRAIQYATMMGFKVTNNSWSSGYSQALYDAISAANTAGDLFIASAGNNSSNNDTTPSYPCSYNLPNIICVAATDNKDQLSTFSNYGATTVHLGAPGTNIISAWPGNMYQYMSGTSMAAPFVSGAAALYWSYHPTLTYTDVKNKILSSTDPIPALAGKTVSGGRLNIANLFVNHPPMANAGGPYSGNNSSPVSFNGSASFDPDNDPLTYTWNFGDGTTGTGVTPTHTYSLAGTYTVTLTVSDGLAQSTSTTSAQITAVNPTAVNDSYTTNENTALTVAAPGVLSNDTDPLNKPLTAILVSNPSHGSLTLNSNGSFTYTPAVNYSGSDSFTYKANNGSLDSNVATASLTVTFVNQPPVAVNDSYSTSQNTALTVAAPGVLANDTDPDSPIITAILVSGPAHGTLTLNSDGSFTYTPNLNYSGPDSFTYKANDGLLDSNIATVSLTITPVNQPPVAVNDSYSTNENTTLTVVAPGVLSNDTDPDSPILTAVLVSNPTHGSLTFNSNGSFTYTPAVNYSGSDSFTYKANDGFLDSNIATVSLTVTFVNQPPVAVNDSYTTNENTTLTVAAPGVLANDTDPDSAVITAVLVSNPTHGTLTLNSNGSFTYTPATNYSGSDSFTYKANDGFLNSNVATVSLTVTFVNQPPVAVNDSYSTAQGVALSVTAPGVLTNDSDVDSPVITAILVTNPAHGTLTLNSNGSFTYTPFISYSGADSFTYKANDGFLDSNVATVSLTITPDATAPTTSITSPANGATVSGSINVQASASDNIGVTKVEFYLDGTLKSTATTSPYAWSWATTASANGSHTLTTKAYDAAGNVGTSSAVAVTVSNAVTSLSFVQKNSAITVNAAQLTAAFPSAVKAGNLIMVAVSSWPNQPSSITDSLGNVYTAVAAPKKSSGANAYTALYYAKNIKGGADTVTFKNSGTGNDLSVIITEFSGANLTSPLDAALSSSGSSSTPTSGNMTPTATGDLVVGATTHNNTEVTSAGTGFTIIIATEDNQTYQSLAMEYKTQPTTSAVAANFSLSRSDGWAVVGALFKHQ
jgi:VCBS repeat-containing protein